MLCCRQPIDWIIHSFIRGCNLAIELQRDRKFSEHCWTIRIYNSLILSNYFFNKVSEIFSYQLLLIVPITYSIPNNFGVQCIPLPTWLMLLLAGDDPWRSVHVLFKYCSSILCMHVVGFFLKERWQFCYGKSRFVSLNCLTVSQGTVP